MPMMRKQRLQGYSMTFAASLKLLLPTTTVLSVGYQFRYFPYCNDQEHDEPGHHEHDHRGHVGPCQSYAATAEIPLGLAKTAGFSTGGRIRVGKTGLHVHGLQRGLVISFFSGCVDYRDVNLGRKGCLARSGTGDSRSVSLSWTSVSCCTSLSIFKKSLLFIT